MISWQLPTHVCQSFTRQIRVYQHEKVGEKVGENRDQFYLSPTICQLVCRLFLCRSHTPTWVWQHEFANFSLPYEGRLGTVPTFVNAHMFCASRKHFSKRARAGFDTDAINCAINLTNRFHVAVRLFSNRSQMTSKCGKNKKVAHEAIAECVTDVLTTF